MNYKLFSKKYMGVAATLLLAILLSQGGFVDFLFETYLGRIALIAFIVFITYTSKTLGILAVLIIVLMFNNSNLGILEGLANNDKLSSKKNTSTTTIDGTTIDTTTDTTTTDTTTTITTPDKLSIPLTQDQINQIKTKLQEKAQSKMSAISEKTATASASKEGFDLIGTENNILRGKQSNSIPVNDFMKSSENVGPYDATTIGNSFSFF